jgi:protoporphyrinogen/coproporphyrinogen III oxidase
VASRVVVIGGGISGLAAAYSIVTSKRRSEAQVAVLLCEAGARLGGCVRTVREGDLLLEAGPDSLVTRKPAGVDLCRELGLDAELVTAAATRPAAQVLRHGERHDLPGGPGMAVPSGFGALLRDRLYSPAGKARLVAERFVRPRRHGPDETLLEFVSRRLGGEAFERVVEPVVGGLFTGDARTFAARLVVPSLVELESRWGSLSAGVRGDWREAMRRSAGAGGNGASSPPLQGSAAQVAPRQGMSELVRALAERLERAGGSVSAETCAGSAGATIALGAEAVALRRGGGGRGFVVELRGRDPVCCDAVVLAVPAAPLAKLLRTLDHGHADALAAAAAELSYASCATVGLAYPRAALRLPLRGLGLFVPRTEGTPILAVSYASEKFSGRALPSQLLLRVFVGGALHPEILARDDRELIDLAHRAVAAWLGLDGRPLVARVDRHADGIPQLVVGSDTHTGKLRRGLREIPGLEVAGSALGVYGIPDCVASGRDAAASVLRVLAEQPRR